MKVLGYKDVMILLHVSESTAYRILHDPDCPLISSSPIRVDETELLNFMKLKELNRKNKSQL